MTFRALFQQKSKDPDFVVAGKEEIKIPELRKKAQILQDSEGWGCLKVVILLPSWNSKI